jgi:hypothetical protein
VEAFGDAGDEAEGRLALALPEAVEELRTMSGPAVLVAEFRLVTEVTPGAAVHQIWNVSLQAVLVGTQGDAIFRVVELLLRVTDYEGGVLVWMGIVYFTIFVAPEFLRAYLESVALASFKVLHD